MNIKDLSPGTRVTVKGMFTLVFVKHYRDREKNIDIAVFTCGGKRHISWLIDTQGRINLELPPIPATIKSTPEYKGSDGVAVYDTNKLLHRSSKRHYIGGGQTPSYGELCVGEVARGAITWNRNYWR